ncbi:hypothetical protein N9Q18_00180 [bacterium]|nr:hypothetical protein [bacterium]
MSCGTASRRRARSGTEVIYRAATDNTDTIRYRAGDNADAFFSLRDGKTDEEYIAATRQQFGI